MVCGAYAHGVAAADLHGLEVALPFGIPVAACNTLRPGIRHPHLRESLTCGRAARLIIKVGRYIGLQIPCLLLECLERQVGEHRRHDLGLRRIGYGNRKLDIVHIM